MSNIQIKIGNNGREPTFYNLLSVIFFIGVSDLLVFRTLSLCCGNCEMLYLDNLFCSCAGEVAYPVRRIENSTRTRIAFSILWWRAAYRRQRDDEKIKFVDFYQFWFRSDVITAAVLDQDVACVSGRISVE